jgi:hypothetical protein
MRRQPANWLEKNMRFAHPFAKRILLLGLALALAFALWRIVRPDIRISVDYTASPKSNFYFIPEHWKESKLRQLRENEDFKDIPYQGQLDLFLKLCDWTHRQWQVSDPNPYPLSNAIDILADIRSGKTGGFCGQYAYVLADVLKAMGFFAVRYVELWSARGESHFVVEAWSDRFAKWMVLDPTENLYYEFQNSEEPANALEVRDALSRPGKVRARTAALPRFDLGAKKMHLYANFAVSTRSDLMRLAKPLTLRDRFDMFVFFKDGATDPAAFNGRIPYTHVTSRISDIYFDCNRVSVVYHIDKKRKSIAFSFFSDASMFNFDGFAVSMDNGKTWERSGADFFIPIPDRNKSFQVAAVNMAGRFGRPTRVEISTD